MIGRRCTHSNVFSRPVLIARNLSFAPESLLYLSQVTYCGGYSGEDPPLPIPNREVKLTSADGTAPPGGRVGSCRFSKSPTEKSAGLFFLYCADRLRNQPYSFFALCELLLFAFLHPPACLCLVSRLSVSPCPFSKSLLLYPVSLYAPTLCFCLRPH